MKELNTIRKRKLCLYLETYRLKKDWFSYQALKSMVEYSESLGYDVGEFRSIVDSEKWPSSWVVR